ncbi:hypothetical protein SAMN04488093_107201 [Tropicibacter naphthalenivorans]|uniref:Regulatory protein SoxS n=2 Tax=Tropicibacter naphthalenivorans TaxID=441103 RepID=A0A0P1G834_9RHOB|nr:thioredoxin family protein [Tropicibacter naphthalenivorans]CUH77829.1 hypothetical protein TRN7648_01640 [Tropicibacter naphthalenivorans]SMC95816.1 hypothetical protein SAMN04488093_107201 [Tropicibacter naphthalenivorans]
MSGLLVATPSTADEIRLIMVEQPGCAYCAAWDDQIAPAYPNTAEGRFAPLDRADLHMGPPAGVTYARRVNFTPTFILIDGGVEIARIEGYPGEDFFWPIFTKLLQDKTEFEAETP